MFPAGHPLRAELAFVDRGSLVGFDAYQLSVADHEVEPTANPAIRAGCGYIFKSTISHIQSHLFTGLF